MIEVVSPWNLVNKAAVGLAGMVHLYEQPRRFQSHPFSDLTAQIVAFPTSPTQIAVRLLNIRSPYQRRPIPMPVAGPEGQILYSAHEAYNAFGVKRYGDEWEEKFTGGPLIADVSLLRRLSDRGERLDPESQKFVQAPDGDRMQTGRRREVDVFNCLLEAVRGKAECWIREPTWRVILPEEWNEGTESKAQLERLLKEDILAVLRDGYPAPNRLLIDKKDLDHWLGWIRPANERSPLVPPKPQPAHRPGINLPAIQGEFHRRCEQGEVTNIDTQGWRLREAEHLAAWYHDTHPWDPHPPSPETIRRRLKPDFDEYERRKRGG